MAYRPTFIDRAARAAMRTAAVLPRRVQKLLSGTPVNVEGSQLDTSVQLALRLMSLASEEAFDVAGGRAMIESESWIVRSEIAVGEILDLAIDGGDGPIPARLYRPQAAADKILPLLIYFHGGGWVLGGLHSADSVCRFLTQHANIAVLSVDYRLAPEHPFPAGVNDALAAFDYAVSHVEELRVDPASIGVGGESAGGNLAAVVALQSEIERRSRSDRAVPAFQLLFMPVTDLSTKHPSYSLFSDGFFLTETQMDWYKEHYLTDPADSFDPRVSPLLADDLTGVAPAYVVTAGFDVLRDEGEAYAHRLKEAGVAVAIRRHGQLVHGLVNATGIGKLAANVLLEAAGAVRLGLATVDHETNSGAAQ